MGVLVVMPSPPEAAERWAVRQLELLAPHLALVAVPAPVSPHWRNVPVRRLAHDPPATWRRLAKWAGLPIWLRPRRTAQEHLSKLLAEDAVTAILVHYVNFALHFEHVWPAARQPVYVHCHGFDVSWNWRRHEQPDVPYYDDEYPQRVRRLAEHVTFIANAQTTAERLRAIGVPDDRVVVKPLGVEVPDHPPARPGPDGPLDILFLNRLVDCKGPDLTIAAFDRACRDGLDARLTLAGDGPLRMACELARRRSPYAERITLLGRVDFATAARLQQQAALFTAHSCTGPLTRQTEAYGVSFVEAMAAGLPVVTGRSGGPAETVVDGETGILFAPGDIAAHASALLELARDPERRQQMGLAGWQRARALFSLEREQAALLRILSIPQPEAVVSGHGTRGTTHPPSLVPL